MSAMLEKLGGGVGQTGNIWGLREVFCVFAVDGTGMNLDMD
jgi:hypothetical protein